MYLLNMLAFLVFGLHFLLNGDFFFTAFLFFVAIMNLFAHSQISPKVSDQSILINFFNCFVLVITAYNYREINQQIWLIACIVLASAYFFAAMRQYILRAQYRKLKKKKLKKFR